MSAVCGIARLSLALFLLLSAPHKMHAGDIDPHAGHNHATEPLTAVPHEGYGEEGHEHGGPGPIHDMTFAEVAEASCEHGVKTVDCEKCRFEVGVVRVDPASKMFRIERPSVSSASSTLELPGECRIAVDRTQVISPRFPARLLAIPVRVGDPVDQGEILAEVESPDLAEAALDFLKRSAELTFAERRARRDAPLAEKKMITDQDYLDGRSAYELVSLEVRLARKRLLLLGLDEEAVDRLPGDPDHPALLGRFAIRAPLAGRVISRHCAVGEMTPADHAILTLADLSTLAIVAQCHERDIAPLRAALDAGASSVEIEVLSYPGRKFLGRVFALDPALARATRTLPVWIEVGNAAGLLADGMFCHVTLTLPGKELAVTLPAEAVLEDEGQNFVFLRGRGDLFITRIVTSRPLTDLRVAVTGIPADAEVVTTGAFLLKSDVLREKMGAGCAD